ncbi:hypothetical protein ACH5RR_001071 [Cinchona calisaya]|uniref:Uncharacterized protein n=1 Tax=Cinchona calisaya TaxID=153742 RepID=A0ABD3B2E1_9GENT
MVECRMGAPKTPKQQDQALGKGIVHPMKKSTSQWQIKHNAAGPSGVSKEHHPEPIIVQSMEETQHQGQANVEILTNNVEIDVNPVEQPLASQPLNAVTTPSTNQEI